MRQNYRFIIAVEKCRSSWNCSATFLRRRKLTLEADKRSSCFNMLGKTGKILLFAVFRFKKKIPLTDCYRLKQWENIICQDISNLHLNLMHLYIVGLYSQHIVDLLPISLRQSKYILTIIDAPSRFFQTVF